MHCPTLTDLPSPPPGKTGWPWTNESLPLPPTMPDGTAWPRVSIVTPSYNQGQFIEETIRSVLLQGYPNLEYIIMDGASTDCSVEIIRKYEPWLAYWVSEKDKGQTVAINKGWHHSTGEVLAYLNSDDTLEPDAVVRAVTALEQDSQSDFVFGSCNLIDHSSKRFRVWVRVTIIGRIPMRQDRLFLFLRNAGAADAWFHDLEIRPIQLSVTPKGCADEQYILFSPASHYGHQLNIVTDPSSGQVVVVGIAPDYGYYCGLAY